MQQAGFDRLETESPFLSFVAEEFGRRGTERRAELAQKVIAHPFVESLGMRVPGRLGLLQRIEDLPGGELPAKFVLKLADGWSARGVMLLECTGPDEYFDHMSLKPLREGGYHHDSACRRGIVRPAAAAMDHRGNGRAVARDRSHPV